MFFFAYLQPDWFLKNLKWNWKVYSRLLFIIIFPQFTRELDGMVLNQVVCQTRKKTTGFSLSGGG